MRFICLVSVKKQQYFQGINILKKGGVCLNVISLSAFSRIIVEAMLVVIFFCCIPNSNVFAEETIQILTDQEFLQKIDLDYPGLENVAAAVKSEDYPLK